MAPPTVQCLKTYKEFCKIKSEWEEFTSRCFPSNYSRTYPWLVAWWKTYHNLKRVTLYIQWDQEGKICAAAPLYSKWELFGGLPVRMLHPMGNGFGADDFLVTRNTRGFVCQVFNEIRTKNWHVLRLSRVSNDLFLHELLGYFEESKFKYTLTDAVDFFIRLPKTYQEYLQSRTRKFRRNLNQAENRLKKMGQVEFVVLDPYRDAARVQEAGEEIARTSWQYKKGLSHYNKKDGGTLYFNLTQFEHGAGGEDFNLLLVDGRPVAYLLGCRRERNYYAIDTSFHEDFRNVSAGRVLFVRIIERLINEQRVDTLDFEGAGEYKDDYSNHKVLIKSISIYNNTSYASLINSFKGLRLFAYLQHRNSTTSQEPMNGSQTDLSIRE